MVNSLSWCRGAKVPSNQGLTQVYATIRYDTPASAALEPLCATWRNMQHVTGKHALDIFWPWNMFRIQLSRKFCEMYIGDHRSWWRAVEFHGMTCGPNAQLSMKNEFCIMLLYILPCIHTRTIWQIHLFFHNNLCFSKNMYLILNRHECNFQLQILHFLKSVLHPFMLFMSAFQERTCPDWTCTSSKDSYDWT